MSQEGKHESLRVAIVEDVRSMRESLAFIVNSDAGMRCVGAVASAEQALEGFPALAPDIVLLDIQLAGEMNGVDCIGPLRASLPSAKIIMMTASHDAPTVTRCLAHGAAGYIRKGQEPDRLPQAIRDVAQGGASMSCDIARLVCGFFQAVEPALQEWEKLSPREQDVLKLLARGLVKKEIAEQLGISEETVRTHTDHIYQKLHVHSRGDAVAKAAPVSALAWLRPEPQAARECGVNGRRSG